MKIKIISTVLFIGMFSNISYAEREMPVFDELTGDTKSACEAILCLSTGTRPSECIPSVTKFFSIWDKKPWKIPQKRFNFLALCPISSSDEAVPFGGSSAAEMKEYMNVIANGASMCSANYLNRTQYKMVSYQVCTWKHDRDGSYKKCTTHTRKLISNKLPNVCEKYSKHSLTDGKVLQTLKYHNTDFVGGIQFGEWRDNLIDLDSSSKSEDDNSK